MLWNGIGFSNTHDFPQGRVSSIQPDFIKNSIEKPTSNFILTDDKLSSSKVAQTSNEEPLPSKKKENLPQSGLFNAHHPDYFEERNSYYQPLCVSSWKKCQVNVESLLISHQPFFQLAQALFVPTLHKKLFWGNLILELISVAAQDFIQPEKFEITNSIEDDLLLAQ
ncbi:hypothetical protein O181_001415 [Austropuccinia psidii MF-1]|uniref:Uncharacterized protein n=1 Tax=Austropuccinia psidii MF-1 TaxID=1389203 RepID=A0A9Q3BAY0_9BASI|nr:hypothetical protein [Austropuccinia psidii MF-1]